ncbi:MAG: hypothetical protein CM1200mP29_14040 [Verrucomicrobiota bacterium]|nr:MAG: hypothetical protein CM1200mP29_14040 [Verrucomicrobiota bacterium]
MGEKWGRLGRLSIGRRFFGIVSRLAIIHKNERRPASSMSPSSRRTRHAMILPMALNASPSSVIHPSR